MRQIVNKAQNAFVEGRYILDATLIVNEVINSVLKKESGLLFKLDIQKAYDHIRWNFLLKVLPKNGFWEEMGRLD